MDYIAEVLYSGEEGGFLLDLQAENDNELWKKLYIKNLGYDDVEEYEEYEGESYNDLDVEECKDQVQNDADAVLIFVYNVDQKEWVYTHYMWN